MMSFYGLLQDRNPAVFNPKVTPDPTDSERLEAKLRDATQRMRDRFDESFARRARIVHRVVG
ncbi:MAG: hypothetical protein QM808_09645 [Steroidobacteraceae bacterium]